LVLGDAYAGPRGEYYEGTRGPELSRAWM
jgi:hypothetical protein